MIKCENVIPGLPRILLIWQDNFWESQDWPEVDWIPTGNSITPLSDENQRISLAHLVRCFFRLLRRRYRIVILPVVNFSWKADGSNIKRSIRFVCGKVLSSPRIAALIRRIVFGNQHVIVLDRQDTPVVCEDFLVSIGAEQCFKVNLTESAFQASCKIQQLPMWLHTSRYPILHHIEKDIDLLFCAQVVSETRRKAITELEQLQHEGWCVKIKTERIPFEEYWDLLGRSWLVVSPEGYGFECFRHYEAMLAGALPLVNHPAEPRFTMLQEKVNVAFYHPETGELSSVARKLLTHKEELAERLKTLPEFVQNKHSPESVGNMLSQYMEEVCKN